MVLGHLAFPTIIKHYFPGVKSGPLYAGSLFPDVLDKSLHSARLRRNGRSLAHTLLTFILTTIGVRLVWGPEYARSWAAGYLGHLICDSDGEIPWLYPFATYEFYPSERNLWQKIKRWLTELNPLEIVLVIWSLLILRKNWQ